MAITKRNANLREENQRKAIEAHHGFVSFVVGKVKKIGIEKVLQQYHSGLGPPTEFHWLKKAYERVLDFAEQTQIKQMPTKVAGEDENGNATPLVVYIPEINREA